jgi:hypothetical protein
MTSNVIAGRENAFALLRRIARSDAPTEHCEFCNAGLDSPHRHLLEVATRRIVCACSACALRFENVIGRWKLIPRDPRSLPGFTMSDEAWDGLALPINLAWFFRSTPAAKIIAMYPSPAGATESLLSMSSWEALVSANPPLKQMEGDVEALLANRLGTAGEYYLVPIDICYELVGTIRVHWRGLSGGEKVWKEIGRYFENLRARAGGANAPCSIGKEATPA